VITVAFPAIARSVSQGAHNGNAEATDRALFWRSLKIGLGVSERIEGWPVVDEIDCQASARPAERHDDAACCQLPPVAVGNNVSEKLFEDDEEPRSSVIGKTAIASECLGKGLEPNEFVSVAS
jgi:hypothetical protein